MHTRALAALSTALLGVVALLLPAPHARAGTVSLPTVVAHRGAAAYAPENTLAAVDEAAELGIRWVENDVQRTLDGELVVIHDDSLRRTTDAEEVFPSRAPWKVGDFTAAEIARLDAGSWFSPAYAGTRVPTLEQYLRQVESHRQRLVLEVKNPSLYPGIEQDILKALGDAGWLDERHLDGRLIVQSFDLDSLHAVRALEPAVRTGFLGAPAETELSRYAAVADLVNPPYTAVSQAYVSALREHVGPHGDPLRVFAWTVDDPGTVRDLVRDGVDGIISNKPDVVRRALYLR
ncbi:MULTISPECIES: glycerophosphodiester phosphodiesterase [unclassified Streptomyces]|uniref:glycerophosphodiester phosphodiesterase n=1 Tax=unclassified Streptomyces TaxID=2593676 RepID=UPI003D74A997